MTDVFMVKNSLAEFLELKEGAYYLNGHGDKMGPMDKRGANLFSDNFGGLYFDTGRKLSHTHDSLGNLVEEIKL